MKYVNSFLKITVVVFFLAILPAQVSALDPSQVFVKVKDSIVVVKTLDVQGKVITQGSGVILPSGKIVTNCHVVDGGSSYQVGHGDQFVTANLYAEDKNKDICLLDAKGISGSPAQLGKAASLTVGDPVYVVGAPMGLELSLSDGIVSQLRGGPPPFIQITAPISPGSSGGGLFNVEGQLVGLITLYIEGGQSLNFAMPVEWVNEIKPGRSPVTKGRNQTEWFILLNILFEEPEDWQGLIDLCRDWTKSAPEYAFAWYSLGMAYSGLNRNDDAIDAFRQALRIDPEYAFAWLDLGNAYSGLNRYDDAIEAYLQALRIDPEDAELLSIIGGTYYKLNRNNDAIDAYRQALRINPENAFAWYSLGMAYYNLERNNDAINAFRQALRINPENADVWYILGGTYYFNGNTTAALEAMRELRRLDPAAAEKLFNLIVPR
jgi:cytochrome c-type biogenesis protein CcmH/NrfG